MPDRPKSIPPPFLPPGAPADWIEESAFRETFLLSIDDPEKRESVRRAGAAFFLMALEATFDNGTTEEDPSVTRAELRAIAADLRCLQGYCAAVGYSAVSCSLEPAECVFRSKATTRSGRKATTDSDGRRPPIPA